MRCNHLRLPDFIRSRPQAWKSILRDGLARFDHHGAMLVTRKDGEFLAVIGLSGSGKSTLLRCINRLIEPTSGKITWNGVDVTAVSGTEMRKVRRQIGMIFQQFNLVKRSSVYTNVLSGRLGYVNTLTSLMHLFSAEDRDRATAEAAFQASLTGHLLLTTFHAGSACLLRSGRGTAGVCGRGWSRGALRTLRGVG